MGQCFYDLPSPHGPVSGPRTYSLVPMGGCHVNAATAEALDWAKKLESEVHFEFNGVEIRLRGDSDANAILRDWWRASSGYIQGPIGPYPGEMTQADHDSDAAVEAQLEAKRAERRAEFDRAAAAKRDAAAAWLAKAPAAMTLRDPAGWQKTVDANRDGYGAAIVDFASRWARIMEARMAEGEAIVDCAEDSSSLADTDGITGFMYGAAVSILSRVWQHGEALRRWHNVHVAGEQGEKVNESGGVINPAIITIG